jgi:hypothetical protein
MSQAKSCHYYDPSSFDSLSGQDPFELGASLGVSALGIWVFGVSVGVSTSQGTKEKSRLGQGIRKRNNQFTINVLSHFRAKWSQAKSCHYFGPSSIDSLSVETRLSLVLPWVFRHWVFGYFGYLLGFRQVKARRKSQGLVKASENETTTSQSTCYANFEQNGVKPSRAIIMTRQALTHSPVKTRLSLVLPWVFRHWVFGYFLKSHVKATSRTISQACQPRSFMVKIVS